MAKEKICGIYKIENLVNGKLYIGSAVDIDRRWREHKAQLRHNRHYNEYLQNSWNKYGEKNFNFVMIEEAEVKNLEIREQYWIDKYNSFDEEFGYNLSRYVDRHQLSDSTKNKIKEKLLEIKLNQGEKCASAKLTEQQVNMIIERLLNFKTCKEIADDLRINRRSINDIKLKRTWKYLTSNIIFPETKEYFRGERNNNPKLTGEQVKEIKIGLNKGESGISLAKLFKVSPTLIFNIKLNKTWTHITI